jgi:hypothetical protein
VALGIALAGTLPMSAALAEQDSKLPTLLIKGEVVSVDTTDPAAALLKVKDRYGFETPIYLAQETKITQGEAALAVSNLSAGTAVEVEYNFDINTAKRHAVSVKVAAPPAPPVAEESPAPVAAAEAPAPAVEPAAEPVPPTEPPTAVASPEGEAVPATQ